MHALNWHIAANAVAVSLLAALCTNLPYFYIRRSVEWNAHKGLRHAVVGHAPNQFLFHWVFFPAACLTTTVSWQMLLQVPLGVNWAQQYWGALVLLGAVLSALTAYFDHRYTRPDFDVMQASVAEVAIAAYQSLDNELSRAPTDKRRDMREEFVRLGEHDAQLDAEVRPTPSGVTTLDARAAARVFAVLLPGRKVRDNAGLERYCDPAIRWLGAIELSVAIFWVYTVFVAVIALLAARLELQGNPELLVAWEPALKKSGGFLVVACLSGAVFPALRRYNRAEIESVWLRPPDIAGEFVGLSAALIIAIALILVFVRPESAWAYVPPVVQASIAIVTFVWAAFRPDKLRSIIGSDSNPGTLFLVSIVGVFSIVVAILGVLIAA